MAAEVDDVEEWALGKETREGSWGVQPSLHASAVLGLSLIPCDSSFQSRIADLMRAEQMATILYFQNVIFLLTFFLTLHHYPRLRKRNRQLPPCWGLLSLLNPSDGSGG